MTSTTAASMSALERDLRSCIDTIRDRIVPESSSGQRTLMRVLALLWSAHDELELLSTTTQELRRD